MLTKINLKSLSKEEIFLFVANQGLPRYRAEQLMHWIYERYAADIDEITEFSMELRHTLKDIAFISNLKLVRSLKSADGAEKFLFSLEDGETIESVLIPDEDRLTLCVSSQVGCSMGCLFCLTGGCGLIRNLKSFEIVDQIIAVNRILQNRSVRVCSPLAKEDKTAFHDRKVTNIVFMGMGEPLANFEEVVEALWRIVHLLRVSKRKITLSTVGIVPRMLLLPQKAPEINLAVSLNATTDDVRNEIMPITKRYPIKSLIKACKEYPLRPGRRITFEYVLIDGRNDSLKDAHRLVRLVNNIRCKINLIPLNPHAGSGLKRPAHKRVLEFQEVLIHNGLRAFIRESKGRDILAACGQLRAAAWRDA
jgi:23S rRNA (adenine2503-C2)-methyltransferase